MIRRFNLILTDADGETHVYEIWATSAWKVLDGVRGEMRRSGDFYGHREQDTIDIAVQELIQQTQGQTC